MQITNYTYNAQNLVIYGAANFNLLFRDQKLNTHKNQVITINM